MRRPKRGPDLDLTMLVFFALMVLLILAGAGIILLAGG